MRVSELRSSAAAAPSSALEVNLRPVVVASPAFLVRNALPEKAGVAASAKAVLLGA